MALFNLQQFFASRNWWAFFWVVQTFFHDWSTYHRWFCEANQFEAIEIRMTSRRSTSHPITSHTIGNNRQDFQVPKMEVLNLVTLVWGWVFPYIRLTYISYIQFIQMSTSTFGT